MNPYDPNSRLLRITLSALLCLALVGCGEDKSGDPPNDTGVSGKSGSAQEAHTAGPGAAETPAAQEPGANKAATDAALANLKKYHFADLYLSASVDAEITESGKKPYTYDVRIDERFGSHSSADRSTRKTQPFRVTWEGNTFRVQGTHEAGDGEYTEQETVDICGEVDPTPVSSQSDPTPARLLWVKGTLSSKFVMADQSQLVELTIESGPIPFENYYMGPPESCLFKEEGAAKAKRTITYMRTDMDPGYKDGESVIETTTREFTGALGTSGELSVSFYHIPK